jgi:hypothetical protein
MRLPGHSLARRGVFAMNYSTRPNVQLPMVASRKLFFFLVVGCASTLSLNAQSTPTSSPRFLIEQAIALRDGGKVLPRYTYFKLVHTQNRNVKGKLFIDDMTLYEYTWIGDLAYGRVIEAQGKPLKGKALDLEQARYDKAVADRTGLDIDARARIKREYLVDTSMRLDSLLTPAYALTELRQEALTGILTHVIDCTPLPSADPAHPMATRHVTLWITDAGVILRQTYDLVADESDKMRGSHGQDDFQLIDGTQLPLHSLFHLNAPNGNTGDFEDTYTRFRRFNVSSTIVPVTSSGGPTARR